MASLSESQVRMIVSNYYPNDKWRRRVANMPSNQVYAIYQSTEARNARKKAEAIEARKNKIALYTPEERKEIDTVEESYKQMNIFDYMTKMKITGTPY